MLPDSYVPHCHHCCKVTYNPIPCRKCSEVEYCSNECLELSEGGYHRWECGGGLILCHSIGIAHLGLRLALVGSDPSAAKQYSRVRKLMSHIDDIVPADLYQYSLVSIFSQ
ncbi:hypothetical protein AAG570_011856 [Ranatra chinensis]|uniref:MYND-type domain-containing protein n=1 Tax=Ranatra chinensis TaxID=642074 RepID=A0ABD0YHJ8_9HEMI